MDAPTQIEPYQINVAQADIDDLHQRLRRARFVTDVGALTWDLGASAAYLERLISHWRDSFDWRAQEARLNGSPQYRVRFGDDVVHFLWYRSGQADAIPTVLTHGWPGTCFEFQKVAPLLAASRASDGRPFDVIVPSLPGFAFSSLPANRAEGYIADLWVRLMASLGYERFIAHGGDLGAGVSNGIAARHPETLLGLHLTAAFRAISRSDPDITPEGEAFLETSDEWNRSEWAYGEIQGSKPATAAAALIDSPVGLAAWLVEKYRSWSDSGGDVETRFTKDELLTTVSLYWFTGSIFRSFIPYADAQARVRPSDGDEFVHVPTGMFRLPGDIPSMPPEVNVARRYNVVSYRTAAEGGHFPAMEVPELLADELKRFADLVS
jgi:pimeloyl-ACP methyl ester carboxylesterase